MQKGYDINDLYQEAQSRWLRPAEVFFILQNHETYGMTEEIQKQPPSGSLFLYNKRVLRFFRKDGHNWRKKKDGKTVGEAHERLKVGNVEALNCYYVHGETNPNFQRRSYWMLDSLYDYIVLVHYREISEGRPIGGPNSQLSPRSSTTVNQSSTHSSPNHTTASDHSHNFSSPSSVNFSSDKISLNGGNEIVRLEETSDMFHALKKIEALLSLDEDNFEDINIFPNDIDHSKFSDPLAYEEEIPKNDQYATFQGQECTAHDQCLGSPIGIQGDWSSNHPEISVHDSFSENKEPLSWKEVLESCKNSSCLDERDEQFHLLDENERLASLTKIGTVDEHEECQFLGSNGNIAGNSSFFFGSCEFPPYASGVDTQHINYDYYTSFFDQCQEVPLAAASTLTIAQKQKFTIQEISPEWGLAEEATKVIIVGSFLCDPSECQWACMFGDIEVPLQIVQNGVIRCEAPPCLPGKVTLCITSGNRESCSELREFEYRASTSVQATEATKSTEESLLLIRFAQLLLADSSNRDAQPGDNGASEFIRKSKDLDDSWEHMMQSVLSGSGASSGTINWLLQELLKDKFEQWISSRIKNGIDETCCLSRTEQGIIHLIAGLGFEWALNPILHCGVSINFRDIKGRTALHWAASLGREKMVAALIASGASPGAVTDPSSVDPIGKTPASVAAASGHKGLAGYLSEVELTSHLSSLQLAESELSKGSAEVQAEMTVNSITKCSLPLDEDQVSLKGALAAVRNAAQAAARIQSAFRAHSFRKRRHRGLDSRSYSIHEYGVGTNGIQGLSAPSKLAFRHPRDFNSAALSIQKKYRAYKGRKDYLSFRRKIVKIQAHVRGYQVRKHYKLICWAVGIIDKVVLRWRRKGAGLRGFRHDTDFIIDESEDEDFLKVFRKQKVQGAIDESISRVLSMVKSSEARQQYHRVLERYRAAKAQLMENGGEATSSVNNEHEMKDGHLPDLTEASVIELEPI